MKIVKFPESNYQNPQNQPLALTRYKGERDSGLYEVYKLLLTKPEIRALTQGKALFITQKAGQEFPALYAQNPITSDRNPGGLFTSVAPQSLIYHQFIWEGHDFRLVMERKYDNAKVKLHWFSITMDGDWIKAGKLPNSLQRHGSGWLKKVLTTMVEEYENILIPS